MYIVMTGFGYVVTKAYQLTCRTDMLNLSSTVLIWVFFLTKSFFADLSISFFHIN